MNADQLDAFASGAGFVAALDQSGGSTPKALREYGIEPSEYNGEAEMFDIVHAMRARVIASPAFSGDRVLAAILFEGTMDRSIDGLPTVDYLWQRKRIVPFVKVDQGLADAERGVQLMKPLTRLPELLQRARGKGVFGTKMRSVVHEADRVGIDAVLDQQFAAARLISTAGLLPIVEPEVSIDSTSRAEADDLLVEGIRRRLDDVPADSPVALKLSLPARPGRYAELIQHPRVVRVLALSGGYSRADAVRHLAENPGVIASFSRALLEGLSARQTDQEFDDVLRAAVDEISAASAA